MCPRSLFPLLILSSLLSLARGAPAEPKADLLRLIPPNVENVVYIPDVQALLGKMRTSPFFRFYNDKRNGDLLRPIRKTLEENSPEIAKILSAPDDPSLNVFQGGLVLARLPSGDKKGGNRTADFILIFEHNRKAESLAPFTNPTLSGGTQLARVRDEAHGVAYTRLKMTREAEDKKPEKEKKEKEEKKVGSFKRSDFIGGKKESAKKPSKADLGAMPGVKKARKKITLEEQIYVSSNLIIRTGGDAQPIRDVLQRLNGKGKIESLGVSSKFKGAVEPFNPSPDLGVYYNIQTITKNGEAMIDEELLGRGGDVESLGVDAIKSAATALTFLPDRVRFDANVFIPQPRRGLANLFFMNKPLSSEPSIGQHIPGDTIGYALFSADLPNVWREFRAVFQKGAPSVLQLVDSYMSSLQQGMDEDIMSGLMSNLGSHWAIFSRNSTDRRLKEPDTTYLIELRPDNKMRPVLDRWLRKSADLMNYKLEESDMPGRHYYRLAGAEVSEGAFVDIKQLSKIGLTDRYMLLSPRFEHMEAALGPIRQDGSSGIKPLSQSKNFQRAMSQLPADRFLELYSSGNSLRTLEDDPFVGIARSIFSGLEDSIVEMDELPEDNLWKEFFGPIGGAARAGRDSLSFTLQFLYAEK